MRDLQEQFGILGENTRERLLQFEKFGQGPCPEVNPNGRVFAEGAHHDDEPHLAGIGVSDAENILLVHLDSFQSPVPKRITVRICHTTERFSSLPRNSAGWGRVIGVKEIGP